MCLLNFRPHNSYFRKDGLNRTVPLLLTDPHYHFGHAPRHSSDLPFFKRGIIYWICGYSSHHSIISATNGWHQNWRSVPHMSTEILHILDTEGYILGTPAYDPTKLILVLWQNYTETAWLHHNYPLNWYIELQGFFYIYHLSPFHPRDLPTTAGYWQHGSTPLTFRHRTSSV